MNKVLIYGPMFAGKSEKLISLFHFYEKRLNNILIFKPEIDIRTPNVHSRNGLKLEAKIISSWQDILDLLLMEDNQNVDGIFVDESQFIETNLIAFEKLIDYVNKNNIFFCVSMLDLNYLGDDFESFKTIYKYFDIYYIQSACCEICGNPAFFTAKLRNGIRIKELDKIFEIDGVSNSTEYKPYCKYHFNK